MIKEDLIDADKPWLAEQIIELDKLLREARQNARDQTVRFRQLEHANLLMKKSNRNQSKTIEEQRKQIQCLEQEITDLKVGLDSLSEPVNYNGIIDMSKLEQENARLEERCDVLWDLVVTLSHTTKELKQDALSSKPAGQTILDPAKDL